MAARRRTEDLYVEGLVRFIVIGVPLSPETDIYFPPPHDPRCEILHLQCVSQLAELLPSHVDELGEIYAG